MRLVDWADIRAFLLISLILYYPILLALAIVRYEGLDKGVLVWLGWASLAWIGSGLAQIGAGWLRWKINHNKDWWLRPHQD